MIRIFAVSGSLRTVSSNTALIRQYSELSPPGCEIDVYDRLGELPHFNPDIADCGDKAVLDLVARVRDSHAFVVSTPEYAHGMPGTLKNCLDWLVGTDAFIEKPFALLSTSPRSIYVRASLIEVLKTMSGIHILDADVTLELKRSTGTAEGMTSDAEVANRLADAMSVLIGYCSGNTVLIANPKV